MIEFNGKFDSRVNKKMTEYQLEKLKYIWMMNL